MLSLKAIKEVQKLTGYAAALGRFMSKSADKCSPFFRIVKKQTFKWSPDAKEAFQQLKKYLANILKLVSPNAGEILYLYVAISDFFLSAN